MTKQQSYIDIALIIFLFQKILHLVKTIWFALVWIICYIKLRKQAKNSEPDHANNFIWLYTSLGNICIAENIYIHENLVKYATSHSWLAHNLVMLAIIVHQLHENTLALKIKKKYNTLPATHCYHYNFKTNIRLNLLQLIGCFLITWVLKKYLSPFRFYVLYTSCQTTTCGSNST